MAVMEAAVGIDFWAKATAIAAVVITGLRYVLQIGALIQRLETLTAEVERLRSDLADARLEVADLKARLG